MNEQYNEEHYNGLEVMERWFSSDAWKHILKDADKGDRDSVELMEHVNDHLTNLIWHMNNNSNPVRVAYELGFFVTLCDDYEVDLS